MNVDLASLLQTIAMTAGVLCTFAALIIYGFSRLSNGSEGGGRAEGSLIGCVIAAISCFAAAAFIAANASALNITF